MKKKFKDTKIGGWIKSNAPHLIDVVGEILPEKGALGIVKNIIQKDDSISDEKTKEALDLIDLEVFALEVEDRKSARNLYSSDAVIQKFLAVIFTVAYFILSYYLFNHFITREVHLSEFEIGFVSTVFGGMSAKVNTIIDFFFGDSVK